MRGRPPKSRAVPLSVEAPEATMGAAHAQEPAAVQTATPSMAQYLEIKTANPDCILWYRMGDFYELFFEDAVTVARALNITLTKRGKHLGQDIPMCGVPVVRADDYLQRLIKQRYRVAVCEQLEDPKEARKRGAKAVVRRDVVRLVTPGTLTEDSLLQPGERNFLGALCVSEVSDDKAAPLEFSLAALDISTGEFEIASRPLIELSAELARLNVSEVIATDTVLALEPIKRAIGHARIASWPVPSTTFEPKLGARLLKDRLKVAELGAFGAFSERELASVGALLRYVELTQVGQTPLIRPPRMLKSSDTLLIDQASRAGLELTRSTSGQHHGSLLAAIDRTVTGQGARELVARLSSPLMDGDRINHRLDAVAFLVEQHEPRETIRRELRGCPDMARSLSRLTLQRGTPKDLASIRDGLMLSHALAHELATAGAKLGLPDELVGLAARLQSVPQGLSQLLARALVPEPPSSAREGSFIASGMEPELDAARALRDDSRQVLARLEARYIEETGVRTLKVRHNAIVGYFIEVSQAHAKVLSEPPFATQFRHRQTLVNAARFSTAELADIEAAIASAAERALSLETELFAKLAAQILEQSGSIAQTAQALAELDVHASLAELASADAYVRPLVDESQAFEIRGGRHPVVEQALRADDAGPFIENDCNLGPPHGKLETAPAQSRLPGRPPAIAPGLPPGMEETAHGRVWLITGPNMAGKSTFLRQNALIAILAQMGSFVPARSAHIGCVDRVFSRVGAADDLARGRSTFMVEMVETASILNQATSRSLVILDEIGRGTATFDGLSIAWACVEHLHSVNQCRTLFATHYHELTELGRTLSSVSNATIEVAEWHDDIVFLHKVKAGAADRSYGIQVGKLAGLPAPVVARAREVLASLEAGDTRSAPASKTAAKKGKVLDDLPLFRMARSQPAPALPSPPPKPHPALQALKALRPDDLTPKLALEELYRLKALADEPAKP